MTTLIAPCGLDCAQCDAYLATQNNDEAARERVAEKWRTEYQSPDITAAQINCDGCTAGGRTIVYCAECQIRQCATGRGLETCASCTDYACDTLQGFGSAQAQANLEALRKLKYTPT